MPNPLAFITILLVSTLTPGPNNILSMTRAMQVGFRRSFRLNLGMYAGFIAVTGLMAIFDYYLVTVLPVFKPVLQYAGAAYILWLSWSIVWGKSHAMKDQSATASFFMGFIMQFINPKVIVFGLTLLAAFVIPYYSDQKSVLIFVLIISTMGFLATCLWGLFGSLFSKVFQSHEKLTNRILAALLAASALSLFI